MIEVKLENVDHTSSWQRIVRTRYRLELLDHNSGFLIYMQHK